MPRGELPAARRDALRLARPVSPSETTGPSIFKKTIVQNPVARHYRGYAVRPSAHRLPDGCFSSNLTLTRPGDREERSRYEFYTLGYFSTELEALGFSDHWGRDWIDTRG